MFGDRSGVLQFELKNGLNRLQSYPLSSREGSIQVFVMLFHREGHFHMGGLMTVPAAVIGVKS